MINLNEIQELADDYGAEQVVQEKNIIVVIFPISLGKNDNYEAGKFSNELLGKGYECWEEYQGNKGKTNFLKVVKIRK